MLSLQELKTMKAADLQKELETAQKNLMHLKVTVRTSHEKNTALVPKAKKYVAQIQTMLNEIKMEEAVKAATEVSE